MAANFNATLKTNEWNSALYNAYKVMGAKDNLSDLDDSLVGKIREEGGMFHDKNQYTFIDTVSSRDWDPTDTNLLAQEERPNVKQQEIAVKNKRQIAITKSYFLDKRAWGSPDSYAQYINLVDSQVSKCKKVYDHTFVNVGVGCMESSIGKQSQTITLPEASQTATNVELEAINRITAQKIAERITNIRAELRDPSTDYNDLGFLDCYNDSKLTVIWNQSFLSKIDMLSLPTVYNDKYFDFNGIQLLGKYFGKKINESKTADGLTHRALNEYKIKVGSDGKYSASGTTYKVIRPGELLPESTPIVSLATDETTSSLSVNTQNFGKTTSITVTVYSTVHAYQEDDTIICKIVSLDGLKYLSGFQTDGTFQNYKSNTSNIYSTFMFSDVEYLGGYPFVTLRQA